MPREITLDRAGLAIDGTPMYLLAGQVHYFRYPRAEWRELLLKAKAGGLNTIDTVIAWNVHEPAHGQFDFSEEADLGGFLDLCAELGLWAIVRPGPYICAEWENGGFPAWFTALEGVELRLDNPVFMEHTLRWFDTLFEILTPRQAQHGGAIILCQIENEHWASGRYGHDTHQHTLANAAIERGMHVPQYTCMGATPGYAEFRNGWSGIAEKLAQTRALWPENPMIVSELWSGWFDNWGASRHSHKTAARFDMIMHQLTAVGASGFSHWMWAGGTNFGYWGGRTVGGDTVHMTTSYDYDAPVSEYGGLTAKFYAARRHHMLLGTLGAQLSRVLADAVPGGPKVITPAAVAGRGEAGSAPYRNVRAGADAPAAWRDFTATFLQNTIPEGLIYQVFLPEAHLAIDVEADSIKPIFTNMPLDLGGAYGGMALTYHSARVLGLWPQQHGAALVLYGFAGEAGELGLKAAAPIEIDAADLATNVTVTTNDAITSLRFWITDRPTVVRARSGGRTLDLVLLTTERAERLWPLANGEFICGPDLVLETGAAEAGHVEIGERGIMPFYRISNGETSTLNSSHASMLQRSNAPTLNWSHHDVEQRATTEGWQQIGMPRALEELGCPYGYGWYRTVFKTPAERALSVVAPWLNDRARVLLDGADVGWLGVHPHGPRLALDLPLSAGSHDLRLLADNLGRFNYGSNTGEKKGLLDTLYVGMQSDITEGWNALWQEAVFAGEAIANAKPWGVRADASDVSLASFAFQGPSVWLLRAFEAEADWRYILHLTGDRNPGALFVNGVNVTRFSRHYGGGFIKADISAHVHAGINVLALNIQNYAGVAYRAHLLAYDPRQPVATEWTFRTGVTPATSSASPNMQPCFHRARFAYDPQQHGDGPFKLYPAGLRKGQIWLNGRNVGRYWQIGPQEAYKLPASWLHAENELLIFEEEGGDPRHVWIGADELGSNRRFVLRGV